MFQNLVLKLPPLSSLLLEMTLSNFMALNIERRALAGVAQWIECLPVNQRVVSSIPSQGTCLGCGPGPQQGVCERQSHTDVSLPLFPPPFPSL